jgi:polysaccharide export outer membrane protein
VDQTPVEGVVETNQEDLSMAKALNSQPSPQYVIGPEDVLQISVFRHEDLTMEATVSSEGMISYYLVGDIPASGLTRFELRDKIEKALSKYIRRPQVIVQIVEARSHKVYALGEVESPGVYHMRTHFTLIEALSEAGGITSDAYLSGAYIVRNGRVLLVNFYELIKKGNTEENIPLVPGDVIYIPSNKDQKVFVLGEVNRQAAIQIDERITLLEAVARAGGFTHDAKRNSIMVMRGNLSRPEIMKINCDDMPIAANVPLQQGDIIYVASSTISNVERVALRISNILQPFLDVARGIILQDSAVDVLEGEDVQTSIVVR